MERTASIGASGHCPLGHRQCVATVTILAHIYPLWRVEEDNVHLVSLGAVGGPDIRIATIVQEQELIREKQATSILEQVHANVIRVCQAQLWEPS